jgi:hypothetical protein
LKSPRDRHFDRSRTAMNKEENRVGAVGAAHVDHLTRAAEHDLQGFIDAVRCDDAIDVCHQRAAR